MLMQSAGGFDRGEIERVHVRGPSGESSLIGPLNILQLLGRENVAHSKPPELVEPDATIPKPLRFRTWLSGGLERTELPSVHANLLRFRAERAFLSRRGVGVIASPTPGGEADRAHQNLTYLAVCNLMEHEQIVAARKILNALPLGSFDDLLFVGLRKILAQPVVTAVQKRDIDRHVDYDWIREHAQEYRGQWVALDEGQLLGAAGSLRELLERIKSLHLDHRPLIHRIQ
jgi:hypothetical protein